MARELDAVRKRLRNKRRCCGLCKPDKRGMEQRWKPRDLALMKAAEREMRG